MTLNPTQYLNAVSNANPGGSYTALAAFQQLTDPVPSFARYYSPSATSTEGLYKNIIYGAAVPGSSVFTAQILGAAQRVFQQYALANMGGVSGTWHPVYASPADWPDTSQAGRFTPITIELNGGDPSVAGFTTLPGTPGGLQLAWIAGDAGQTRTTALNPSTNIQRISFQALRVDLSRPWLSFEIFQTRGWTLQDQPAGIVSSGKTDANTGMMPLIATGLIVGFNVAITADWAPSDLSILRGAGNAPGRLALGPFAISSDPTTPPSMLDSRTVQSNVLQVLGWISEVVPFSPSATGIGP